jgi:hypothetical protein
MQNPEFTIAEGIGISKVRIPWDNNDRGEVIVQ